MNQNLVKKPLIFLTVGALAYYVLYRTGLILPGLLFKILLLVNYAGFSKILARYVKNLMNGYVAITLLSVLYVTVTFLCYQYVLVSNLGDTVTQFDISICAITFIVPSSSAVITTLIIFYTQTDHNLEAMYKR